MYKKLILKRSLCALLSVIMIAVCLPLSVFAADPSEPQFSSDAANTLMKNTKPTGFDNTTNPYGYDVGRPFAMVEKNELLYFETYGTSATGKIADVGTPESLKNFISKKGTASDASLPNMDISALQTYYAFVQSVSFDPFGSGRRDHVAYVGLDKSDKQVYLHIYDTRTGEYKGKQWVGEMNWMFDNKGLIRALNLETNAYLNITAGDFDGDGKDTLIIYVPHTKRSTGLMQTFDYEPFVGCFLYEYSFTGKNSFVLLNNTSIMGEGKKLGFGNDMLHDSYKKLYHTGVGSPTDPGANGDSMYGSSDQTFDNRFHKLGVDMVVGDFNGDQIDDIAVLSYFFINRVRSGNFNVYRPQVKIKYGKAGGSSSGGGSSFVDGDADEKFYVCPEGKLQNILQNDVVYNSNSMNACSITAGDFNNDGYEDILVAGLHASVVAGITWTFSSETAYTTLLNNGNRGFVQSEYKVMASNGWTKAGSRTKEVVSPLAVEAVAFNGASAADFVFINGTLYNYNAQTGELYKLTSNEYSFRTNSNGSTNNFWFEGEIGGKTEFFRSVAVGNFDGNNAGREQIVFVTSAETGNEDKYSFSKGMISATYPDTSDSYEAANGFDLTLSYWSPNQAYGDYYGCTAQVLLTACDRNQDGVIAKYKGVSYAYSDPEVKAVIQAAPYFSALSDSGENETAYTITESFELEQSSSNNVSFSVGMSYSYGGLLAPVEVNISAGYSLEWSKTYSTALQKEYSLTVKARAYNTVLVSRTPVFIYAYEILDENGKWSGDTAITLSIPQQPVYQQLSVDDYNGFVDEYNGYMNNKDYHAVIRESDKTDKDKKYYYPLVKIDKAANWLDGNEGNPFMYNQLGWGVYSHLGAEQLSQLAIRLGHNGGLNEVSWQKSNIKSVSEEMSHGFYFNFSISYGVFGDGILFSHDVGFETSLNYSNGSGVSTTTTSSEGCTGVVNDIDGPDLASNGIPQNVYTQYTFDWTLGQWFRHLYGDENNKTIFIGYNLTNLSAPSPAVVDLEAELLDEDEIRLTWSQPDKTPGWPDAEGYYLYQVENGEYNRISNLIPVGTTSYDISGLKTNTEYEYVLTTVCKVDGKDKESAWSNSATITTAKRDYKVNYKIDNEKAADISVRHLGNVNIKSGDEINESDIIKIRVSPKNRHFELVSLTLDNGGEETVFRPDLNGNIECAFALGGEANIFVSTRKTFDSAEVIFVGEYKNGEDLLGTVTAKVGETDLPAPGGTVTGDVTFTAVPQNGYTLKSWRITDAENNTDIVNAAGSNTYTLTLGSTRYTVEAEFERVSETDRPVKLTYSVASGNETGMAATKQTYQSGTAVPVGTKINFIAQAAEGYRVQKLVITKNGIPDTVITDNRLYDMYEYELTVDTQTDIKVYFTEIEKYTVTVDMPNKNAEITVKNGTSDFENGQKVNFGDEITVTVKPKDGYRLADTESWSDNGDGSYTYKTGRIKMETHIRVAVEEIPEYTVTFPTMIEGCVLTVRSKNEKITSGSKIREGTILVASIVLEPSYILKGWYIGGEFSPETNKTEVSFTVDGDTLLSVIVENVKGDKGDTGIGIKSAIIDESGNLIITLTDDTVLNLGKVTGDNGSQGEQGVPGAAGVGVKSVAIDENGNLVITLTDNSVHNLGKVIGDNGSQGEQGVPGAAGVGVKSVAIDENGNLVITLTDNTVHNLGKVVGDKGEQGVNGVGVKSVMIDESGNLIITLTDETVHNAGRVTGDKGDKGDTGNVGVGVKTTEIDENGNLIITLTDDTVHNLGKVVGAKGEAGTAGTNGINGTGIKSAHIDADGNLILTFTDGVITNLGKIVGTDGKDGVNGKDGTNGKDGKDGKDGLGIKGCRIDDGGDLIITLTDNTTLNAGNISAISDKVSVSKPLATAAVSLSGVSLLWNIVSLVAAIVRKKKLI